MIPNEGELQLLNFIRTAIIGLDIEVRLLKGNVTPAAGDVLANYAVHEANFSGYVRANVSGWGSAAINGDGKAEVSASQVTFTHSGGGTANDIYCWVLADNSNGKILKAVRFSDAPRNMSTAGSTAIAITPRLRLSGV